jgi:alpha/beta superfamily hydrolase
MYRDAVELSLDSDGVRLAGFLAEPAVVQATGRRRGLVLCHGFPAGPRGASTSGETYPELAASLANATGWTVLTFNFRGTGESAGDFSLGGWLTDLRAAVDRLTGAVDAGVWLAGFSVGGALALCVAGEDERIRGVASLAAPADFEAWAAEPAAFLGHARELGVIRKSGFPADFAAWAAELSEARPLQSISKIPPRPVLLVHGDNDDVVPLSDGRALADAAGGEVDFRVVAGGSHRLRHDPRATALLQGWLDRQDG